MRLRVFLCCACCAGHVIRLTLSFKLWSLFHDDSAGSLATCLAYCKTRWGRFGPQAKQAALQSYALASTLHAVQQLHLACMYVQHILLAGYRFEGKPIQSV